LKAVYDILASSAETIGTFNTGFDTVNLHRPTVGLASCAAGKGAHGEVAVAGLQKPMCSGAS